MKLNKLKRHLETVHAEYIGITPEFFHTKAKIIFAKRTVPLKPLPASFKVAYRIAKWRKFGVMQCY
jgi:hypothetical protein